MAPERPCRITSSYGKFALSQILICTLLAVEALRRVAGWFSFLIFALGIIGTGFLAVPVLSGSAAYAIGEARRLPVGLARKPMGRAVRSRCTLMRCPCRG